VSREGGDNHFISARERDLKPLLEESRAEFELGREQGRMLESSLETAWLAGTRSGHAKLLNEAIRHREEHPDASPEPPPKPVRMEDVEAEFKAMMEASAKQLDLSPARTVALWDLLSRAWAAGVRTYESELMASLIERRSDIAGEAERWLGESGDSK
jgi:hypothetical protein